MGRDARTDTQIRDLPGRTDPAGVVEALRPLASDTRLVVSQMAIMAWWPTLVEGLIEAGETTDAAAELDRLQRHVDQTGMDIGGQLNGLRARLAAAIGDPDDATHLFEVALDTIRADAGCSIAVCYNTATVDCCTRRSRRDAVVHLRDAHELFAGVGAEPFRHSVADDLASCGIRTAARQSPLDFTEREQDVVALVRKGMTKKEVAAEIYVSEKAEYHLRNVYGKLGVTSRRELRLRG